MDRATAVPPATAREPPSQKSFCTSTMMSARTGLLYAGGDPPALGFFTVTAEDRGDRGVAAGQLHGVRGEFSERCRVPRPGLPQGLASDDLPVADEFL